MLWWRRRRVLFVGSRLSRVVRLRRHVGTGLRQVCVWLLHSMRYRRWDMGHRRLLRMIADHVVGRMREILDGRQIAILGRWVLRARGIEGGHGALACKS